MAEPANHTIHVRTGRWCDTCALPNSATYEVRTADGDVAAVLHGCVICRTGVCAPPPGVVYIDEVDAIVAGLDLI